MPYKTGPSDFVIQLLAQIGEQTKGEKGHVFTTVTDVVAGGAAVARTRIEEHRVPDAAKMGLGWRPMENVTDAAAAESPGSVVDIAGGNFKFPPQEVLTAGGRTLLLEGSIELAETEYYDLFAPVAGGETIDVGIEPLDTIAGNRRAGVEFTWTDFRLPMPVIYSRCSREVTVDGAGISAGTTFNENNTHMLIEAAGIDIIGGALTVEEEITVSLILKCTVWQPVQEIRINFEPVAPVIDAVIDQGEPMARLARRYERLKFTADRAAITADFDLDVDVTNASLGAHMLRWV